MKLDIPDSIEVLLDSVGHGSRIRDAIVDTLIKEGKEEVKILQSIQEKVETSDLFYKDIRSGYFRIIQKYLEKQPTMSQQKEALVKDIVFTGMLLYDYFAPKDAIQCSHYFPELIPKVLPEIIDRATTATDLEVRRVSTEALGELGDPSALSVLAELLDDNEPTIRQTAVYAVAKLQVPSVVFFCEILVVIDNRGDGIRRTDML